MDDIQDGKHGFEVWLTKPARQIYGLRAVDMETAIRIARKQAKEDGITDDPALLFVVRVS